MGRRVESSISSFKRTFGAHVKSTKWKYMVNEMFAKARLCNMFSHKGVVKEKKRRKT
jgi:hypothetical protein